MRRQSEDYPRHHACSWLYGFVVLIVSDEAHIIIVLLLCQLIVDVLKLNGLGVVAVCDPADAVREHSLERNGLLGSLGKHPPDAEKRNLVPFQFRFSASFFFFFDFPMFNSVTVAPRM